MNGDRECFDTICLKIDLKIDHHVVLFVCASRLLNMFQRHHFIINQSRQAFSSTQVERVPYIYINYI